MKTDFHNKNFALSLAFIMRFKATRKWPIDLLMLQNVPTLTRKVANHSSISARDLIGNFWGNPAQGQRGTQKLQPAVSMEKTGTSKKDDLTSLSVTIIKRKETTCFFAEICQISLHPSFTENTTHPVRH